MYLAGCLPYQKNGAVVREAVGCTRLVGVRAYQQLREVYQVLRLVVNCFQPSLKLQAHVPQDDRVRRVYDVAQTPLQRLLASGVLSEDRQRDLRERLQQIDPLVLSEQLDALRYALLCDADGRAWPQPGPSLQASEEEPARTDHQEAPWSSKAMGHLALERAVSAPIETHIHGLGTIHPSGHSPREESWPAVRIQGGHLESLSMEPDLPEEAVSGADQYPMQAQPLPTSAPGTPGNSTREGEAGHGALITIEQAIAAYVQEMRATGRAPKTLQWHQTSLGTLRRYLWRQFHFTDIGSLTRACLQSWVTDLHFMPSARTGATRTVNTVAAYARSARAFCGSVRTQTTPWQSSLTSVMLMS